VVGTAIACSADCCVGLASASRRHRWQIRTSVHSDAIAIACIGDGRSSACDTRRTRKLPAPPLRDQGAGAAGACLRAALARRLGPPNGALPSQLGAPVVPP
jgi:hypothetical protein